MCYFLQEIGLPTFQRKKAEALVTNHKAGKNFNPQHRCEITSNTLLSKSSVIFLDKGFCYLDSLRLRDPTHILHTDNGSPPTFSRLEAINPAGVVPTPDITMAEQKCSLLLNILPSFQGSLAPPHPDPHVNFAFRKILPSGNLHALVS